MSTLKSIIVETYKEGGPHEPTANRTASEALKPGHLLLLASATTLKKHDGAAKNASGMVALESDHFGKGTDDAYAIGDAVRVGIFRPGERAQLRVAASATAITVGAFLEPAADGTIRIATTDAATDDTQRTSMQWMAEEAVDNSAGGSEVFITARRL